MDEDYLMMLIEKDVEERGVYSDYLVRLRYKHYSEKEWTYTNEYLEFNAGYMEWCWLNDWYEGQQDIEFLGFIAVDDIEVPIIYGGGTDE